MASHVVVIDTTARRATVKVTPQTYLNDVLGEACKKLGLRAELYGLKYANSFLYSLSKANLWPGTTRNR
jgi:tether containing UBX domain for GLUT4